MRTSIHCIIIAIIMVLASSCKNQHKELPGTGNGIVNQKPNKNLDPAFNIFYKRSTAWGNILSYDSLCAKYLGTPLWAPPVNAFTIRAEDLLGALGMPQGFADSAFCKYKNARVYLGFDPIAKTFKLFVLPVKNANLNSNPMIGGEDVFVDSTGNPIDRSLIKNASQTQYVMDLNAPCPNTCASTESSLLIPDTKKP